MKSSRMPAKDPKSLVSKPAEASRLAESGLPLLAQASWPVCFPRIKPLFRAVQPAANEPVILRFSSKAMFERECENLTFGAYERFQPGLSLPSEHPARKSQPLRRRRQSPKAGQPESKALAALSHDRTLKDLNIQQARDKLFLRFPVAHAVFSRRNNPVTILKQSEDCEY